MPQGQDPAEGDRKTIERELARQHGGSANSSAKNPEREAEHPGGRPTEAVKGSAPRLESTGQHDKPQSASNPIMANPHRGN